MVTVLRRIHLNPVPAKGWIALALVFSVCRTAPVLALEADFIELEQKLARSEFELQDVRFVRFDGDRNYRAWFVTPDGDRIDVKVQRVSSLKENYNEIPRYDIVAYQLQKLILDPADYVVPPAVLRSQPVGIASNWDPGAVEVRKGSEAALFLIQAWVPGAEPLDTTVDLDRIATDDAYARAWANFNVLTHLIRHNDSNRGNVLIVDAADRPRIYAVDNDVSFLSDESRQGNAWRKLWTNRFPRELIDRLAVLNKAQFEESLGIVAEFQLTDSVYQPAGAGEQMSKRRGIRQKGDRLQFGLTAREIWEMDRRLQRLQKDIERGKIEALP